MNPNEQTLQSLQLRDIHLPASPEFWPPAPAWWLLALLIGIVLGWIIFRLIRLWQRRRAQLEIFSLLDEISNTKNEVKTPEFLSSVSTLLRRVALLKFPPKQVAALTGKDWLSFLDIHGGDGQFQNGAGRVLECGPYMSDSNVDQQGLLLLARKWIKRNTGASGKHR